jgi:hypothetical protein
MARGHSPLWSFCLGIEAFFFTSVIAWCPCLGDDRQLFYEHAGANYNCQSYRRHWAPTHNYILLLILQDVKINLANVIFCSMYFSVPG